MPTLYAEAVLADQGNWARLVAVARGVPVGGQERSAGPQYLTRADCWLPAVLRAHGGTGPVAVKLTWVVAEPVREQEINAPADGESWFSPVRQIFKVPVGAGKTTIVMVISEMVEMGLSLLQVEGHEFEVNVCHVARTF